jgi:hypothetical protein
MTARTSTAPVHVERRELPEPDTPRAEMWEKARAMFLK